MCRVSAPLPDIKPATPVARLDREAYVGGPETFSIPDVAPIVGMSPTFIKRALGVANGHIGVDQVIELLDQDSYAETFVRRSQVIEHLLAMKASTQESLELDNPRTGEATRLLLGDARDLLNTIEPGSIDCVVTSTPYWAMRVYDDSHFVSWADGEVCPYGHEQTPEGFIRHTTELLYRLYPLIAQHGSVWWNVMDTFNTRTQIRGNAAEALRAMQGHDKRAWHDHESRRYSAGHSYLKDGEQIQIPARIAERASRIGYYVKSTITWAKPYTTPEPQNSRVSRSLEYVIHLTKQRAPRFSREPYRQLPPTLGGRNTLLETDKLSDVWHFATASGGNGHGAQFPIALPARCIALSTNPGDVVLDPFVGGGSSGVAARSLGRRFVGMDVVPKYLAQAEEAIASVTSNAFTVKTDGEGRVERTPGVAPQSRRNAPTRLSTADGSATPTRSAR
jgi:DNA modification methylase